MTIKECVNCPEATDHSTAECPTLRVPRELLERTINRLEHGHEHDKAIRELRALLTAQPQARACVTCGEPTRFDKPYCEEHCYELPQASAAQSAPPASPEGRECPRYICRKCKQETRPPEPYKAYVLCDCGYMTSATTALAATPAQPAMQEIEP